MYSQIIRESFIRVITTDGNFKADHLTPQNEDDDVNLTVGEGFMTVRGPYGEHLKDATARAPPRYQRKVSELTHYMFPGPEIEKRRCLQATRRPSTLSVWGPKMMASRHPSQM
jgi:hypothetical protein